MSERTQTNSLISVPFDSFVSFIASLPLLCFVSCVTIATVWHFEETTWTHCQVPNYLPSISAAIGGHQPEKFIWHIGIALHCLPRILLFPAAVHKHYQSTLSGRKHNLTTWWFWLLNLLTNISQVVENGALLTLTYISSSDNFDVHEGSFIVFMVCSMIYMFFSCVLLKLTSSQPITTEEHGFLKRKVFIVFFNYCSFVLAVYFYFRHDGYCEPGVYTLFALCEYCTIVSNILFHWFSLTTHFKGAVLLLAYGESDTSKMS